MVTTVVHKKTPHFLQIYRHFLLQVWILQRCAFFMFIFFMKWSTLSYLLSSFTALIGMDISVGTWSWGMSVFFDPMRALDKSNLNVQRLIVHSSPLEARYRSQELTAVKSIRWKMIRLYHFFYFIQFLYKLIGMSHLSTPPIFLL